MVVVPFEFFSTDVNTLDRYQIDNNNEVKPREGTSHWWRAGQSDKRGSLRNLLGCCRLAPKIQKDLAKIVTEYA